VEVGGHGYPQPPESVHHREGRVGDVVVPHVEGEVENL
jgi:hypothetical protein